MSNSDFIQRVNETTAACPSCSSAVSSYAGVSQCEHCDAALREIVADIAAGRPVLRTTLAKLLALE